MVATGEEEIEVKFYLRDLEGAKRRLEEVGAELVRPRTHEFNLRFDTPEGKLSAEKRVLRLRRDDRVWLTYKGKSDKSQGVNARLEIEFEVGDFEAGQRLLEALGYQVSVIYEKYRTTCKLDGMEIVLDEMPFGNFIEIEGAYAEGIKAMAERLGLDWNTRILESYLELFKRVKGKLGLDFKDLTFENFEGVKVYKTDFGLETKGN